MTSGMSTTPASRQASQSSWGTCSTCGKALAPADILYTDDARVVCVTCSTKQEIVRDEKGAARNIRMASFTCLGAALFGFAAFSVGFGLFFYAGAIISIASGIFAGQAILSSGDERFTKHIAPGEKTVIVFCTVLGLLISSFETLVILGVIQWTPFWLR
jgi:hypothetical protein